MVIWEALGAAEHVLVDVRCCEEPTFGVTAIGVGIYNGADRKRNHARNSIMSIITTIARQTVECCWRERSGILSKRGDDVREHVIAVDLLHKSDEFIVAERDLEDARLK